DTEELLAGGYRGHEDRQVATRRKKAAEATVREKLAGAAEADLVELINELTGQMHAAAEDLHFELAARLRDEI
ncbi:UvrABC system protein B, partial [human gut metagenome]